MKKLRNILSTNADFLRLANKKGATFAVPGNKIIELSTKKEYEIKALEFCYRFLVKGGLKVPSERCIKKE